MGISPDLGIEQKKIEVKNRLTPQRMIVVGLSQIPNFVDNSHLDRLKNSFDRGLKQNPDVVAIEVSTLEKRERLKFNLQFDQVFFIEMHFCWHLCLFIWLWFFE